MKVEEEYQDVLQNIEFMIVDSFRGHPELSDHGVLRALEAVADSYTAEAAARARRQCGLSSLEQDLFTAIRDICQWRLGRADLTSELSQPGVKIEPMAVDEINLCLKRLMESVRMWNSRLGSQGYLQFVSEFF